MQTNIQKVPISTDTVHIAIKKLNGDYSEHLIFKLQQKRHYSKANVKKRLKLRNTAQQMLLFTQIQILIAYVYVNTQFLSGSCMDYFLQQVNEEEFSCLSDEEEEEEV